MMKLKLKLSLFNLLSKLVFAAAFLLLMPYIIERINLRQVDNDLIQKREQVISLIGNLGLEPFIASDSSDAFGSFNILKEEFISLEKTDTNEELNYIEETPRFIEGEEINYRVLNYSFKVEEHTYLLEVGKSLSSIQNTAKNIRNVMLIFLLFIILITFLTDVQYTNITLKPLDRITRKLKEISDPALFDMLPLRTTTSDFQRLDQTLRSLMTHINVLFQKEKEITINISHELMTPVSVLRSKLENILLREDLNPEIAAKIEESLKTLHRLRSLVNSLLLIARIESHQYLREDSFSINEILMEITKEIRPIAEDAGVSFKQSLTDDFHLGKANKSLIFSMLFNIVNNAVKNTPAGGEIMVNSIDQQGRFTVIISDTGKGLTDIQKDTIFSRFKMRDQTSGDGTGIGLAIAKTIADFHNIEISVTSEAEKGTTFIFLFPGNS